AYQLQPFQIVAAPDWIASERFDIVAKAEGELPMTPPGSGPAPEMLMLRTLLADRFKLRVHDEKREMSMYALGLARADGKLGPGLRPSTTDCAALMAARGRGAPPQPPAPGVRPPCGMRMGFGEMVGGGLPLGMLIPPISQFVQRTVVDRTGLTGN